MEFKQAMSSNKISIGLAGLGFGESVHLEALKVSDCLSPIGIWHHRKERLEESSKKNNLRSYLEWENLIGDKNIEGVIIATPPSTRFTLAEKALKAGKHLLLEKPVGLNAEEVASLQRLAMKNNLTVAVDFEYRAVPLFMQLKRLIESDIIGKPWLVKFDWLMSSRADQSRPWNWYSEAKEGGGVIGALGTHAFDIINWVFGQTTSVNALISTSIKNRIDPSSNQSRLVTSEDIALAQLEVISSKHDSYLPVQISLSAITRKGRGCWIEVYGENGTIILGSENQKDYVHGFNLWLSVKGEKERQITPDEDLSFARTWTDGRIAPVLRVHNWWAQSILSRQPMIPGLSEGWSSQIICDKVKESSENGMKLYL